jgi:hypothetical protein
LSGTVSANIIRPDGGTVAATGTFSGNECSVVLPAAAYAYPGVATIVIKLTDSGVVTTLLAVVVTIYRTSTDTAVDPGTIIPSIQTLLDQIDAAIASVDAAIASIPADYSSLWTTLAPAYSTSATYAVGQYVTNGGKMYRCISAISSGETWTAAHWSDVKIGDELSSLKSAITDITGNERIELQYINKYISLSSDPVNLTQQSLSGYGCGYWECSEGDQFVITGSTYGAAAWLHCFLDSDRNKLTNTPISPANNRLIIAPENAAYLVVNTNNISTFKLYKGNYLKNIVSDLEAGLETVNTTKADAEKFTTLSNAFDLLNNYSEVVYTPGKMYRTSNSTVSTTPEDNSDFCCALVPCTEGDLFTVTGEGGYVAHYCVFIDSSGNKLADYGVPAAWAENVVVIAPKNAAYLVLNNYNALGTPKCNKNGRLYEKYIFDMDDFEEGGLSSADGTETTASRFRSKDYLDLSDIIKINAHSSNRVALFCYTSESASSFIGIFNGSAIGTFGNVAWLTSVDFARIKCNPTYRNLKYRIEFENTSVDGGEKYQIINSAQVAINALEEKIEKTNKTTEYIQEQINEINSDLFVSDRYFISDDRISVAASSSDLFALYDALVTAYPSVVSKNTLTSGSLTNYEYVLTYGNYNASGQRARDAEIVKPTILITTGVHGDEKSAIMSTYALIKAMCEGKYPASSILAKCKIRIIPCVTAWGFDNNKRWNANGVNINRNFDAGWTAQGEAYTSDYSGTGPASEDETKIVQNWIDAYKSSALVHFDFHNSGFTSEVSYLSIKTNAENAVAVKKEYLNHICDISGYWESKREMSPTSLIFGYTGYSYTGGGCDAYGTSQGVFSSLIETSWNQNSTGLHSNKTIGIGCEALSCILLAIVEALFE